MRPSRGTKAVPSAWVWISCDASTPASARLLSDRWRFLSCTAACGAACFGDFRTRSSTSRRASARRSSPSPTPADIQGVGVSARSGEVPSGAVGGALVVGAPPGAPRSRSARKPATKSRVSCSPRSSAATAALICWAPGNRQLHFVRFRLPPLNPRRRPLPRSARPMAPGSTRRSLPSRSRPAPESHCERAVVGLPLRQIRGCFSANRHPQ